MRAPIFSSLLFTIVFAFINPYKSIAQFEFDPVPDAECFGICGEVALSGIDYGTRVGLDFAIGKRQHFNIGLGYKALHVRREVTGYYAYTDNLTFHKVGLNLAHRFDLFKIMKQQLFIENGVNFEMGFNKDYDFGIISYEPSLGVNRGIGENWDIFLLAGAKLMLSEYSQKGINNTSVKRTYPSLTLGFNRKF